MLREGSSSMAVSLLVALLVGLLVGLLVCWGVGSPGGLGVMRQLPGVARGGTGGVGGMLRRGREVVGSSDIDTGAMPGAAAADGVAPCVPSLIVLSLRNSIHAVAHRMGGSHDRRNSGSADSGRGSHDATSDR